MSAKINSMLISSLPLSLMKTKKESGLPFWNGEIGITQHFDCCILSSSLGFRATGQANAPLSGVIRKISTKRFNLLT